MNTHHNFIYRCLTLAKRGAGNVAPNPMVGAVLVHNDRIIGEGWHEKYGGPHAEVNCINNAILGGYSNLISESILYVSLEPCSHFGKTPPCADLIIEKKIPQVIIGCRDPFIQVDGRGIEKLMNAGIKTEVGILEEECKDLNKRFLTFHTQKRPYIILKWAETQEGIIGTRSAERLLISSPITNREVHKWRAEESAILIGTNTALLDDPQLTNRYWPGSSPIRLVIDLDLKLPASLKIFNADAPTVVFNASRHEPPGKAPFMKSGVFYCRIDKKVSTVKQISSALYEMNILSVLVEGGRKLLQSFIDGNEWDEVRKISNKKLAPGTDALVSTPTTSAASGQLKFDNAVMAPQVSNFIKVSEEIIGSDSIEIFKNQTSSLTY
jgi:diaminohydroxyphosphoribosylaminopyrimidine deaminase / 5-amino-6-(5-phosphoribosylamino)uracil reductase